MVSAYASPMYAVVPIRMAEYLMASRIGLDFANAIKQPWFKTNFFPRETLLTCYDHGVTLTCPSVTFNPMLHRLVTFPSECRMPKCKMNARS